MSVHSLVLWFSRVSIRPGSALPSPQHNTACNAALGRMPNFKTLNRMLSVTKINDVPAESYVDASSCVQASFRIGFHCCKAGPTIRGPCPPGQLSDLAS